MDRRSAWRHPVPSPWRAHRAYWVQPLVVQGPRDRVLADGVKWREATPPSLSVSGWRGGSGGGCPAVVYELLGPEVAGTSRVRPSSPRMSWAFGLASVPGARACVSLVRRRANKHFGQRIVQVSSVSEKNWKPSTRCSARGGGAWTRALPPLLVTPPPSLPAPPPHPLPPRGSAWDGHDVPLPLLPGADPEPQARPGPPQRKAREAWRRGDRRPDQPGHVLVQADFPSP